MIRLDVFLAKTRKDFSRSFYQQLIRGGAVKVSGIIVRKPHALVTREESIEIIASTRDEFLKSKEIPEGISPVIFQDKGFFVFNKPHGLRSESLFKGRFPVHRIDRDTSGVLVVASNRIIQAALQKLWHDRKVLKQYTALVSGALTPRRGAIEGAIHRKHSDRTRMAISAAASARKSYTAYRVKAYYKDPNSSRRFTLLTALPRTGRTHQIRVHFASIKHPVAGDRLYGDKELNHEIKNQTGLSRQFLHAAHLSFRHPKTGKSMAFTAPLPQDLSDALLHLKKLRTISR